MELGKMWRRIVKVYTRVTGHMNITCQRNKHKQISLGLSRSVSAKYQNRAMTGTAAKAVYVGRL